MKTKTIFRKQIRLSFLLFLTLAGTQALRAEIPAIGGVYQISTASQLKEFADGINNSTIAQDAQAHLTCDIDLSTVCGPELGNWPTIGNAPSRQFTGKVSAAGITVSHLYINAPSADFQGLFGHVGSAEISGITVSGSVTGQDYVAGLVGGSSSQTAGNVYIHECGNLATVSGRQNVAGLYGCNVNSRNTVVIKNCYNAGAISGSTDCATLAAYVGSNSTVTGCFNCGTLSGGISADNQDFVRVEDGITPSYCYTLRSGRQDGIDRMTTEQFANGEITWKLNQQLLQNEESDQDVWYQTLGEGGDAHPRLTTDTNSHVYYGYTDCDAVTKTYSNNRLQDNNGHLFENDTCQYCGLAIPFEVPQQIEGVYQIGNAAQLYWFLQMVGNNPRICTDGVVSNPAASAVLTDDIDFRSSFYSCVTSDEYYEGDFDGNGHRILLNVKAAKYQQYRFSGLFGTLYRNACIHDLVVGGTIDLSGASFTNLGSIAGSMRENTRIERCISGVEFYNTSSAGKVGGLAGYLYPGAEIRDCVFNGSFRQVASNIGSLAGYSNRGSVANCLSIAVLLNCVGTYFDFNDIAPSDVENGYHYNIRDYEVRPGAVTLEQLNSGWVGWKLNEETNAGPWLQKLGSEPDQAPSPINSHETEYRIYAEVYPNGIPTGRFENYALEPAPCPHIDLHNSVDHMTYHPYTAATCTAEGSQAYYQCEDCQAIYTMESDIWTSVEDPTDLAIDALGHNYAADGFCVRDCGHAAPLTEADLAEDGYYEIGTHAKLVAFYQLAEEARQAEQSCDVNIRITQDIDATRYNWTPIHQGYRTTRSYNGIIDGGGHTITLYSIHPDQEDIAFIGCGDPVFRNLTIKGTFNGSTCVGAFLGESFANRNLTWSNLCSEATIEATGGQTSVAGGFIGLMVHSQLNTTFDRCVNKSSIHSYYGGGFIGSMAGNVSFRNCLNQGVISGNYSVDAPTSTYRMALAGNSENGMSVTIDQMLNLSTNLDGFVPERSGLTVTSQGLYNRYGLNMSLNGTSVPEFSANELTNGYAAWTLNNGCFDGTQAWYQTLGDEADDYPGLTDNGSNTVYALKNYYNCTHYNVYGYGNEPNDDETFRRHDFASGNDVKCSYCDTWQITCVPGRLNSVVRPYEGTLVPADETTSITLYEFLGSRDDMLYGQALTEPELLGGHPYLFQAGEGCTKVHFKANDTDDEYSAVTVNGLHGVLSDTGESIQSAGSAGGDTYIVFTQNGLKLVPETKSVTIGKGRAYISLNEAILAMESSASPAPVALGRYDTATALNELEIEASDGPAYNLQGLRVEDHYRGLIIKNGKLYLRK